MSVSTAIGMVSKSLRKLLIGEMTLNPQVSVTILGPDERSSDRRVNLFLYQARENAALRNTDWQVKRGEPNTLVPPPLSLNLSYLMTAYAPNDQQTGNSAAHEILGDAMRVFYENAIVPPAYLEGDLINAREKIKITLNTLDMEELSKIWSTFTKPYRVSVLYEVSVVQLDMLADNEKAMAKRVGKIGIPGDPSPFQPPTLEQMEPGSGPAGTVITFKGKNLAGWKAYVTMTGKTVVDGTSLSADMFQMTVPNDLPPGFHEIRVDVSHLFRRAFFFEVTA